jgi:hypothetical protein
VVITVSLNAIDRNATMIEESRRRTLIENEWYTYRKKKGKRRNVLCES